jgi:hypothetical protein
VTVLEDRGPADELAPAAAARSPEIDEASGLVRPEAEAGSEAEAGTGAPLPEAEAVEPVLGSSADAIATTEDAAEDVPADEERAEA